MFRTEIRSESDIKNLIEKIEAKIDQPGFDPDQDDKFQSLLNDRLFENVFNYRPIHIAAKSGFIKVLGLLIQKQKKVNTQDNSLKDSPLHVAAENNQLEAVKVLCDSENITQLNRRDRSSLDVAIVNGHYDIVSYLLTLLKDEQIKPNDALQLAVVALRHLNESDLDKNVKIEKKQNYLSIIKLLITRGAEPNIKYEKGETPLHIAAKNGDKEFIEFLLSNLHVNANIKDDDGNTPLHLLIENKHGHLIDAFFTALKARAKNEFVGADYVDQQNNDGNTPLHIAAEKNDAKSVTSLVNQSANANIENNRQKVAWQLADDRNYETIAKRLENITDEEYKQAKIVVIHRKRPGSIASHVDSPVVPQIPVMIHDDLIELIAEAEEGLNKTHWNKSETESIGYLATYPNVRSPSRSALYLAIEQNKRQVVHHLVKNHADLRQFDGAQEPPLHFALRKNQTEIARFLIASKADIEARDSFGYTPLHIAAINGKLEIVNELFQNRVSVSDNNPLGSRIDINPNNGLGETPLHLAIAKGRTEIVRFLLAQEGIDVNQRTKVGETPLHLAIANGHTEIVRLLLSQEGIDVYQQTLHGRTPLELARQSNHLEAAELINNHIESKNKKPGFLARNWKLILGSTLTTVALGAGIGAVLGVFAAPFTFGLSIPAAAAVGGLIGAGVGIIGSVLGCVAAEKYIQAKRKPAVAIAPVIPAAPVAGGSRATSLRSLHSASLSPAALPAASESSSSPFAANGSYSPGLHPPSPRSGDPESTTKLNKSEHEKSSGKSSKK